MSASIERRVALLFGIAALTLELLASAIYAAAVGVSAAFGDDTGAFLHSHAGALIRVGSLVDMFGYLCALPVALYLRRRFPFGVLADVFAAAGIVFVIVGAIGAAVMATAAAPLLDQYPGASPSQRAAIAVVFESIYRAVVIGLWQTLEAIAAAVWLVGTGVVTYLQRERLLSVVLSVLGAIMAVIAVSRLVT